VFLARFQREALAAAGLSHPNIVTIYDVGEHEGMHYIAMEYLEGGSLRDRIAQGAIPLDQVERILAQVASALDYAHARNLIHRDIKPGNILFTADGRPKVADFGIARPTEETRLTQTGLMMGTPDYMAPREVNPALPVAVEKVILKSLSKDPAERYQHGADLAAALRGAADGRAVVAAAGKRSGNPLVPILAVGAVIVALLLAYAVYRIVNGTGNGTSVPSPTVTRVAVITVVATEDSGPATIVPDVTLPIPVWSETPRETITEPAEVLTDTPPPTDTIEPSDTPPPTETLPPSDAPTQPPTHTPLPEPTVTDTPPPPTAASPKFGRLAFSSNRHGNPEIYVVDLAGGSPARLTNTAANEWLPDWDPGGSKIAFTSNRRDNYDLWSMNANGNNQNLIVATGAWDEYASWAPDGQRLAFSSTAVTQNVANSEIFVRLADGSLVQRTHSTAEDQNPDWSPDGRIIYSEGMKGTSGWDLWIMNGDGSGGLVWRGGPECEVQPSWSPNGEWIAFVRVPRDTNGNGAIDEGDAGDIWTSKVGGGSLRQLTSGIWAVSPAWSPDSQWVAFTQLRDTNGNGVSDQNDAADILAVPRGGGDAVPLVTGANRDGDPSWTQ
jgi:serine/threonine protein kinase